MEELIPIVNELQDAFASFSGDDAALDLPQIAVVGNQSAGKSSVLENIVGRDFLPRGTGIVTRRPLILQLVHTPPGSEEYGEFLHRRGTVYTDFEAIREEISQETARVSGVGKAVSASPISLRLHSPRLVNLTLVDLPGMTKVPVGDQPADIEAQIRAMLSDFIDRPNCLILAVSPANSDLATSDALQLAQQLDPAGVRTIGVLTKLDLMDEGTDAGEILRNTVIPLRLGYAAVVNRSQRDIEGRKDITAALEAEGAFFTAHPAYASVELRGRCGTENLRKLLSLHLTRHIAATLPGLKTSLRSRLHQLSSALGSWRSEFDYDDAQWRPKAAVRLAIQFAEAFKAQLLGDSTTGLSHNQLSCGAKIMLLFHRGFRDRINRTEWTQEALMKRQIGFAIENIKGIRPGMFTPDQAFDRIIREQITHLRAPTMEILDLVESEMVEAIGKSAELQGDVGYLGRFPELAAEIKRNPSSSYPSLGLASNSVSSAAGRARERVSLLLDFEHAYINTKHEDFVTFETAYDEANRRVRRRKNPGETVKKEGWLQIVQGFASRRRLWFVLTLDNISWYSDVTKTERLYMVPLTENIKLGESRGGNRFSIYGDQNIVKDKAVLELQCASYPEFEEWQRSLMQVGVFPAGQDGRKEKEPLTTSGAILDGTSDADLERQIESLWILVDSYMRIIAGTLLNVVPKCVVRSLVRDSVEWVSRDLVTAVSRLDSYDALMEEDESQLARKLELEETRSRLQNALDRLTSLGLASADLPPPVHPTPRQPRPPPRRPPSVSTGRAPSPAQLTKVEPRSHSASGRKTGKVVPQPRDPRSAKELAKALRTIDSGAKSQFY